MDTKAAANLANHDAIGPHSQTIDQQLPLVYGALAFDIGGTSFETQDRSVEVTASFGLCGLERVPVGVRKLAENVVKVADAALYRSKNAGRNRVTATMFPCTAAGQNEPSPE